MGRSLAPLAAWLMVVATMAAVAAPQVAAGTDDRPEVSDDNIGEHDLPEALNLTSGWVGNETQTTFSVFMEVEHLSPPQNHSRVYHFHFHFQVVRSDGSDALYHAMVHLIATGGWAFMTQRWVATNGDGSWGETTAVEGVVNAATGVIEVKVPKSVVASPRIDVQHNTWRIDHFFIHADEVDATTGRIFKSDAAPPTGTMGGYDVAVGAPAAAQGSPGPGALLAIAAVAAAAMALAWKARRSS